MKSDTETLKVPYSYLAEQFADPEPILNDIRNKLLKHTQFTFGPELEEFERNMAGYTGAQYCLGVSSGTVGLSMLLQSVGVGHGDEVITVSQTFFATIGSIVAVGARPYYIDVTDDYTMDPEQIEAAITPRTKAIMPVHYSGSIARMNRILEIADKHSLPVIEDSCCAISGTLDGRHVGTFGKGGAFSVHPLKNLNVWGDGGVIVTNDEAVYKSIFLLRNHGIIGGAEGRDEIEVFGYNARLDTIQAIVGNYLFPQIDDITNKRIGNAEKYDKAMSIPSLQKFVTVPPRRKGARHVYHMYMLLVRHRDKLLAFLQEKGIEAKIHYPIPMHMQPASLNQEVPFPQGDLSKTEAQVKELITLPVHQHLSAEQTDWVVARVQEFYEEQLWK